MGRVGTSWEPKKLQNFDIKKNVLRKKEEERRKKKNIGYRVASNERRLKTLNENRNPAFVESTTFFDSFSH